MTGLMVASSGAVSSQVVAPAGDPYKAACLADSADLYVRLNTTTPFDESASPQTLTALYSGPPVIITDPLVGPVLQGQTGSWKSSRNFPTSNYTIEGVGRFAQGNNNYPCLIGNWQSSGVAIMSAPAANQVTFVPNSVGNQIAATLTVGNLYHFAATYNGTTAIFYVNGVSIGSRATGSSGQTNPLTVCTYQNSTLPVPAWNNSAYAVSSYTSVLSPTRIAAHNAALPAH